MLDHNIMIVFLIVMTADIMQQLAGPKNIHIGSINVKVETNEVQNKHSRLPKTSNWQSPPNARGQNCFLDCRLLPGLAQMRREPNTEGVDPESLFKPYVLTI